MIDNLIAALGLTRDDVRETTSTPWASLTFSGSRHVIHLNPDFDQPLPDREHVTIRDHMVVDIIPLDDNRVEVLLLCEP